MDPGMWLWKKKSSERTTVDKSEFSFKGNHEERTLPEKLSYLLDDCTAKDEVVASHSKAAQEAFADWEKAEAEAKLRKQERDEALQRKVVEIENFYAALKDCMQQLISSAREHDERVHEAVMKASKEFDKKNKKLEEKYVETSRMVANLTFENSQLTTALQVKEKLTDDANEQMSWTTGEFDILMVRLDSKETENAFLKSEFKKLEKELEIRNEEMEFNRRSSDALEKKHLENVRKINKLEAECRKLRAMVRKQIPGSPEPERTNSIVEMQGKVPNEVPNKRISFMSQRICEVEAENKALKEIADSKDEELRALRTAFASLSSKLLQVEDQLGNHSESQKSVELIHGFASWASTLLSQLENFKHRERENASECQMFGVSDTRLMNDFVEKDKLAIVSANPPSSIDKEQVPTVESDSINTETRDLSTEKPHDWLQNVLTAILEQNQVSKRSMDEILEDIRVALKPTDQLDSTASTETNSIMSMKRQLEESEQSNERLQLEVESLQESKRVVQDQIQNQKLINEDLITELTASKVQLNEVIQKLSSLELELEDRSHCCEELEAACLKLQHQLESVSSKELPKDDEQQDENLFHRGWETTAASAQLAEFQETILNHAKQLPKPNSPKECSVVLDMDLSEMGDEIWSQHQHASLLDHMIAEDGVRAEDLNSPKTKEIATTTEMDSPPFLPFSGDQSFYVARPSAVSGALSIVSTTKRSGGISLLRKLIFRMKKGGSKKKPPSLVRYRSSRDQYFL